MQIDATCAIGGKTITFGAAFLNWWASGHFDDYLRGVQGNMAQP
jgi:hypothetical protein